MARVKVYEYWWYDGVNDTSIRSDCKRTAEQVRDLVKGQVFAGTEEEVDSADLDDDGRYYPATVSSRSRFYATYLLEVNDVDTGLALADLVGETLEEAKAEAVERASVIAPTATMIILDSEGLKVGVYLNRQDGDSGAWSTESTA